MKVACYTGSCSGGANSEHPKIYGCYNRGRDVNDEPAWYKSEHSKAIWWEPIRSDWVIGDQEDLGGIVVYAKAHSHSLDTYPSWCPRKNGWRYYDGSSFVSAGRTLSVFEKDRC